MTSNVQRSLVVSSFTLGLMCLTACGGGGDGNPTISAQPAGYAYVASVAAPDESMPGAVFQYSIGTDGSLTASRTASVPSGPGPVAMVSDPTGRYVYVANQGNGTISQYSIGAGGVLAPLSPATVNIGGGSSSSSYSLSLSQNGRALYVVTSLHNPPILLSGTLIVQFAIGNNGTLSPLNSPLLELDTVAGRGPLVVDHSGSYAYLAGSAVIGEVQSADGVVLQFFIGADDQLTPMPSQAVAAPRNAVGLTISGSGSTAYVLGACTDNNCDGEIAEYAVSANGMLTPTGATTTTAGHVIPISLAPDTSDSSAYLLTNLMGIDTNAGAIYQYTINSAGALVAATPPSLNLSSGAVTQLVFGRNLYALSSNSVGFASGAPTGGHIDRYNIGVGGILNATGTTSMSTGHPTAMTVVAAH